MITRAIVPILLAACASAQSARAADWYWRPAGPTYGKGDGSTYADAWNGTAAIDWARMRDGDTLYVCGLHDGGAGDRSLGGARSGITVSGRCPGDPGTVIGASLKITAWTSGPDRDGIWSTLVRAQGPPDYAMSGARERVLKSTQPLSRSTPCNRFHDSGDEISFKPCDSASPPVLWLAQVGDGGAGLSTFVTARDVHDLRIEGLSLYLYYSMFVFHGGRDIVLDGVTMRIGSFGNELVHLDGRVDGFTLRRSVLCDAGNGLYGFGHAGNPVLDGAAHRQDHGLVEDNEFCLIRANTDSHGVGLQNGDHWIIRNNRFRHIEGSAVTLFLPAGGPSPRAWSFRDVVIEKNVVESIHAFPAIEGAVHSTFQRGIEVTGDAACDRRKDDIRDIVIRDNRLTDVQRGGIYVQAPQTSDGTHAVVVEGNLIERIREPGGFGILWSNRLPQGCTEARDYPAPSVRIAGNTVREAAVSVGVYTGTRASGSANFADLSQVELAANRYDPEGRLVWPVTPGRPGLDQRSCKAHGGTWDATDGSWCQFDGRTLGGFKAWSGEERDSVAE